MMTLNELLQSIFPEAPFGHTQFSRMVSDSRIAQPGDLFFAYLGQPENFPNYIKNALENGAAAIIKPGTSSHIEWHEQTPIISLTNLEPQIGRFAANFYGNLSAPLKTVGVTGTNGKTSCSQYIAQALQAYGQSCGVIGTLGYGFPNQLTPGTLTTPDVFSLQKYLAQLRQEGAQAIAMEVSSQGLAEYRVDGIPFTAALFTNLTRDHIDYHGSFEAYAAAKERFFTFSDLQFAVFNLDDTQGRKWAQQFSSRYPIYGYSLQDSSSPIYASDIQYFNDGTCALIRTPWGKGELRSNLLGQFNLSNLLGVLSVLCGLGLPLEEALKHLRHLQAVTGRMQTLGGQGQPVVVVDYAHSPDALEKVLLALRAHIKAGKLWVVFGCGGDRDPGKRPLMGDIAERYSDYVIVTNDNPRHEEPDRIIGEIMQGISAPQKVTIIPDRAQAIAHAISSADIDDVVLIAGKGHELYQQIGDEKRPFNDLEQAHIQLTLKQNGSLL